MIKKLTSVIGIIALSFVAGCGSLNSSTVSESAILRPATGISAPFEAAPGVSLDGSCKSPLIDPVDGTEIRIERSFSSGMGEYSVPEGKYGVGKGELIRVNCNTGEVVGIVKE